MNRQWPLPGPENEFLTEHVALLVASYRRVTGRALIAGDDPGAEAETPAEAARRLFEAPFAVVSHDTAEDPRFNYANRVALTLFEVPWEMFIGMPSRLSAEIPRREERERLLETVKKKGFIDDYRGVRISGKGRRFLIEGATVWSLYDEAGNYRGQAARFDRWT
jgi:hypothetical protein